MNTITVEVTAEDIAAGARGTCSGCPLALAMSRALGETIACGRQYWWQLGPKDFVTSLLPAEARGFVIDFDCRLPVQPFTFTLTVPS